MGTLLADYGRVRRREGRGIYAVFNCLGLPPQGTTPPPRLVPAYRKNSLRSSG